MPWSAYTSHHGRWAYVDHLDRWCWVPARRNHGRHVADDTPSRALPLPFDAERPRTPRRLGRNTDSDTKSRGGTLVPQDDDDRRPVAASPSLPRRIDANRAPVFQRGAEPGKLPRTAGVPRSAPQPQRAAPADQGNSTQTLRPSRPANSSNSGSEATSRPAATTSKGFAIPQDP
jgi:hypothetical protein